jgi:hypothetical protein
MNWTVNKLEKLVNIGEMSQKINLQIVSQKTEELDQTVLTTRNVMKRSQKMKEKEAEENRNPRQLT